VQEDQPKRAQVRPIRERIRQIEAKALRMRQPSCSGKLRLFLDDVHV
jgi:DNA-directed RNA polymerase sigma subunit (sigma70/sigma32)